MFLTVHSLGGIIIGQQTENIWLAFLTGIFFHFFLDMIPHGDDKIIVGKDGMDEKKNAILAFKMGAVDGLIMIGLLSGLYFFNLFSLSLAVIAAVIGSVLPDFITTLYILTKNKILKEYVSFHWKIHFAFSKSTVSIKTGMLIQVVFLFTFISIIKFL
ncbi:MAG: hypothetical protein CMI53_03710 [Parcubacteria group bacterium]|nr:hypothetical protein [Parcubacteria group bacterium]|tara:strand:+ start:7350 stop:7823 length:474 start_codon:yes stop_codon:yes gene_type:complete